MLKQPEPTLPSCSERVAENLEQSGLRFTHKELGNKTLCQLFEEGKLTRAMLEQYGFFLIDDYNVNPADTGEKELPMGTTTQNGQTTVHKIQWLHRDGYATDRTPDVITLRYTGESNRDYATMLAPNNNEVAKACLEFFAKLHIPSNSENVRILCAEGRRSLGDLGVTNLGDDQLFEGENFDQLDAKTFLLDGGAARKSIDDQPFLGELYDYLEKKGWPTGMNGNHVNFSLFRTPDLCFMAVVLLALNCHQKTPTTIGQICGDNGYIGRVILL